MQAASSDSLDDAVVQFERIRIERALRGCDIERALRGCDGNESRAARELGLTYPSEAGLEGQAG